MLLGTYNEYMNRFVNPITNGQYTDSTPYDIQLMRKRAHVLHKLLDGCVQRRDYSVLAPFLPPKLEFVVSIKLTPLQCTLYKVCPSSSLCEFLQNIGTFFSTTWKAKQDDKVTRANVPRCCSPIFRICNESGPTLECFGTTVTDTSICSRKRYPLSSRKDHTPIIKSLLKF